MRSKTKKVPDPAARSGRDADTTAYAQQQGGGARPGAATPSPRMPHERDESARATGNRLDESAPPSGGRIDQAREDIEAGQQDTDRRGVPNDMPGGGKKRGK